MKLPKVESQRSTTAHSLSGSQRSEKHGCLGWCINALKGHFFYINSKLFFTLFIDGTYRRKGYGTRLIHEMEKKAHQLGANMIRLDTFDWQGKEFYKPMGFKIVGSYENKVDVFS